MRSPPPPFAAIELQWSDSMDLMFDTTVGRHSVAPVRLSISVMRLKLAPKDLRKRLRDGKYALAR